MEKRILEKTNIGLESEFLLYVKYMPAHTRGSYHIWGDFPLQHQILGTDLGEGHARERGRC